MSLPRTQHFFILGVARGSAVGSVLSSSFHCMNDPQPEGSHGKPHRTTKILRPTLMGGGAAAAWPLAARAQQGERMRRIGVLVPQDQDSPVAQARIAALMQELRQLGWTGRNARIDIHWAGADAENIRKHAAELATLGTIGRHHSSDRCPLTRRLRERSRLTLRTSHTTINGGRRSPYVLGAAPLRCARVQGWISGFGVPADPWPSLVESRCATAAIRRVLRCGATTAR
jgi:hypothetical protein